MRGIRRRAVPGSAAERKRDRGQDRWARAFLGPYAPSSTRAFNRVSKTGWIALA